MSANTPDCPIRLLHLSDIHFRAGMVWDSDPVLRALAAFIREEVAAGLVPDLVAITGDLTFGGKTDEYQLVRDWLDRELWPALTPDPTKPLPRERLLLVPGNHDVDREAVDVVAEATQHRLLAMKDQDLIAKVLGAAAQREVLLKRHRAFLTFYGDWLGTRQDLPWWQRVIAVCGQRLHIAGLDTAWMAWGDNDRGDLLLGSWQVNQIVSTKEAESADWRLALLHHPWDYLAEFDSDTARQAIHLHRDLVLRGHLHQSLAERIIPPDPARACLELAAGCVYENGRYRNAFQWVELHAGPKRVKILFRAWVNGAWTIDRNQPGCPGGEADFDLTVVKNVNGFDYNNIGDLDIYDSGIFIGRQQQISDIDERLKSTRQVTIVGLGGIGKTRLVTEIIKRKIEDAMCREAIVFVSFAYVTNDSDGEVLDTLVSHLKLAPTSVEDRLPAIVQRLKVTPTLLVLDNCETAPINIVKVVSILRGRCRDLKILVASQHQLGFKCDAPYRLPPLSVPDDSPTSLDGLVHLESYKLFYTRAKMADDTWVPEPNSASSIRQLLRLTEGIPLAIEIVAAWAPFLSLSQICDDLAEDALMRGKPPGYSIGESDRHQSMLRCFEWSLRHLSSNEAEVFRRLGVFESRFTEEAVNEVCEVNNSLIPLIGWLCLR